MPDIHVSMLALHVPNVLPKSIPWIDFARHKGFYINHHSEWVAPRPAASSGRSLIFAIGIVHRVPVDQEAEAARARDVGADDSRRDGRVGDDGARLRHDPARVDHLRHLVPQLQHRDVPACRRTRFIHVRHHPVGGRRHRRDRHLRHRARAPGLALRRAGRSARRSTRPASEPRPSDAEASPAARWRACAGAARSASPAYGRPVTTAGE